MCDVCGCGDPHVTPAARIRVEAGTSLLSKNDRDAARLRARFRTTRTTAVNVMGSPGSGKTALLEATALALRGQARLSAVSGDLATDHDAQRLAAAGIVAGSITTGTACHLDAAMVERALDGDDTLGQAMRQSDLFLIENVGNLVCPAIYDLGQAANVVVLSVTEGVDKPLKYPVMFKNAQLVVLSKCDLLPHLPEVKVDAIAASLAQVMPEPRLLAVSTRSGEGMHAWLDWLRALQTTTKQQRIINQSQQFHKM